ncbi:hypothetical protein [Vibrio vulnificus]|uniref:hypothetical protein n=1 Tax=Vibrio vulnificus TaxID=672 RepID=UPI003ED9BA8E
MNTFKQRNIKAHLLFAIVVLITASSNVLANNGNSLLSDYHTTSDILNLYGLDSNIPKLAMNSLLQGEHLVEHASQRINIGEDTRESSVYLVKTTDVKGNIDLRVKYNPSQVDQRDNMIEILEKFTRTEYRLRNYVQSYDPSSVVVKENSDGKKTIEFDYSKYGLPQDIAYFRHLTVKVSVVNESPIKMVITNKKEFGYDGYQIDKYKQIIKFNKLDGKLLITNKKISVLGRAKGKPLSIETIIVPVAIYTEGNGVSVLNSKHFKIVSDPRLHEANIKVDRVFPLLGNAVRRQGIDLPLPFGISAAYRNQSMDIPFTDFVINGIGLNDIFDPLKSIGVVNAQSFTLRGDVNILPFWNVYGLIGKLNVEANVDAEYTGAPGQYIKDELNDRIPFLNLGDAFCKELSQLCNTARVDVPLHLNYDLVGIGSTLSVGYREFFASLNGSYTSTRLEGSDTWSNGIVTLQPMLGYQLVDYRTQIFLGAEYQGLDSRMNGHVTAGNIEFDYDIGVTINRWSYLIGLNKQLGRHYNLSALYSKGESRDSITLNFGYRF